MPFGLTNAPASFQNLVNDIFADFLDIFVVVYLDDIMVFSSSQEEHVKHVASVLQRLRDNNLFAKASKCVFHSSSVEYLGYVVSSEGFKMDSSKIQQIVNWPQPKNIKALQSFLGFANFYHRFIKNYSKKISALTSLLKKDSPFMFNEEALSPFQILREAFTTAPILSHFNPSLPTIVETDASDYAMGAVLSPVNDAGKHPIAFYSCKLLPAELNYEIHDKELLGIVWALKRWRAFLLSLSNPFEVLTDHSSLQYFMSSKVLTPCQARWAEFLSEFHFTITDHPGRLTTLPDALLFDKIQKEVWKDNDYKEILKQLARGESVPDYSLQPQAKLLLFKDRVVIPSNEEIQLNILQKCHESPLAGHPGQEKTLKLMVRDFYWAGINQFINDYVSSCQQCSRNKKINHKKFGLLKPLQIPSGPWSSLSMEFITQLPLSNNFESILVAVDRFSKMTIFIPTYGTISSLELAQIFISHVFYKHGLQVSILSDRGSLFVSSFWTDLCQKLKISRDHSTAFHPETDGQTERVNKMLEQYLWMYVSYHQDDWHIWLPLAEFSYNNAEHSSTKQSRFLTIYGRNPSFDSIHVSQDSPSGKLSTKLQSVQRVVKEELKSAIRRLKKYADRNRSIPPDFQPGDKVWLASKNIKTTRPTKTSSERRSGPFEVLKKIGSNAYHLKFPQKWKSVHPVFHVSLLDPVKNSTIPNRHQLSPPPVLVEEQEEWEVSQVLDSKLKRGKLWYLVEWKGFSEDPERTTWEPASNLTNLPDLFKDFHPFYLAKPGPNTSRF
ncbi:hypothetical protein O181_080917 [Austropuccinia psidii MF-1]|uniref:Reverse transcriptase n=1 Tax=Austropuccinia psidii MF-1 TaxID=1389203 RepID=A0A9Q3FPR7_9BASI|nr:hypothetical protein [Austropuccinia psidii MF-1]